jgi:hypothetical protein
VSFLFFQKKKQSVSSASQKKVFYQELGEADPGVWGLAPEKWVLKSKLDS